MKTLIISILLCTATPSFGKTTEAVVNDAIAHGAHLVRCVNHACHDTQTGEYLGDTDVDGAYLVFPDKDMAANVQKQMQPQARKQTMM